MPVYLDCPCCGDEGAESDDQDMFADAQPLICGCPGQVSCDAESDPYINIDDMMPCVACDLRARVAELEAEVARLGRRNDGTTDADRNVRRGDE